MEAFSRHISRHLRWIHISIHWVASEEARLPKAQFFFCNASDIHYLNINDMIFVPLPVHDVLMTFCKVSLQHRSVCGSDLKLSVSHKASSLLQSLFSDCVCYLHIAYNLFIGKHNKIVTLFEIYLHNVSFSFFRASKYFRLFSFSTYWSLLNWSM